MGKILEVKNLTVHIKTHKGVVQAVRGVDFYLNEQETLCGSRRVRFRKIHYHERCYGNPPKERKSSRGKRNVSGE